MLVDFLMAFLDDDVLGHVVEETNRYGTSESTKVSAKNTYNNS